MHHNGVLHFSVVFLQDVYHQVFIQQIHSKHVSILLKTLNVKF